MTNLSCFGSVELFFYLPYFYCSPKIFSNSKQGHSFLLFMCWSGKTRFTDHKRYNLLNTFQRKIVEKSIGILRNGALKTTLSRRQNHFGNLSFKTIVASVVSHHLWQEKLQTQNPFAVQKSQTKHMLLKRRSYTVCV